MLPVAPNFAQVDSAWVATATGLGEQALPLQGKLDMPGLEKLKATERIHVPEEMGCIRHGVPLHDTTFGTLLVLVDVPGETGEAALRAFMKELEAEAANAVL